MQQPLQCSHLKGLLAFSRLLDSCYSRLCNHQIRTAYISLRIALELKLSPTSISDLLASALMHDIGALSPEDKFELHEGLIEKLDGHCILGAKVLKTAKIFEKAAGVVRHHHTPFKVWGTICSETALLAQILNLADNVERAIDRDRHILLQYGHIKKDMKELSNTEIEKNIVEGFLAVAEKEGFWLDIVSPLIDNIVFETCPVKSQAYTYETFHEIGLTFRKVTDFRSRFTATHCCGVEGVTRHLTGLLGCGQEEALMLQTAANVHDIGKMVIPTHILEKPGKLNEQEYCIVKSHPYYTYMVLKDFGLDKLARYAGFHHEKLNGEGYPFRKDNTELCFGSSLIAVADIFTALAEDRPYRRGLGRDEAVGILNRMVENQHLSREIVGITEENYMDIYDSMVLAQKQSTEEYFSIKAEQQ